MIEVSEVLLLESSAPDSQKRKKEDDHRNGQQSKHNSLCKVNKSLEKVSSPELQKTCIRNADSFGYIW